MAYQTEAADSWPDNVYQVATTDPVVGGPDGPVNVLGAALATRSRYQRIRNITPWNAALVYPEHSYCQLAGVTYKSLTANTNVQPGTPAAAAVWTRWGHTEAEMSAFAGLPFAAPALCPDTGPAAGANTKAVYKSSLGEYWMYLGDAWRVIAGRYVVTTTYANQSASSAVVGTHTAKRATTLHANLTATVTETTGAQTGAREMTLVILKNGVIVKSPHRHIVDYGYSNDIYSGIHLPVQVTTGDVISFQVNKTSPYNVNSIETTVTYGD